jgi:phosphatidylserine/phosphatidylglycerophosphate/cardiolipin synthase-like enzyme
MRAVLAAFVSLFVACAGSPPEWDDNVEEEPEVDDGEDDVDDSALGVPAGTRVSLGGIPAWVHVTNPVGAGDSGDRTILREVVRLIKATPAGARIRAAIHSLTVNSVANALIAAHERGVIVEVAEDGSDESDPDDSPRLLAEALGRRHVFCGGGSNHGCITRDASGIMHTKLITFSATTDPTGTPRQDVVWFGSANLTNATGAKSFNNTVTIYGDKELFDSFTRYFTHLFEQRHYAGNNYYDAGKQRGFYVTPTARVYASPEQQGDLIHNRLNDIVAGPNCEIRIAQAMLFNSRTNLIDLIGRKKRGGCKVWIVGNNIQSAARSKLKDLRGDRFRVRTNKVHDKYILVDAKFAGSDTRRKLVFTGSHNWTQSANYVNDELFVRLEGKGIYDAYVSHFETAFDTGKRL